MTLEEARKIMTDPEHPLHKRYKQSDPSVTGEVDKAFQQSFGSWEVEVEKIKMGAS